MYGIFVFFISWSSSLSCQMQLYYLDAVFIRTYFLAMYYESYMILDCGCSLFLEVGQAN